WSHPEEPFDRLDVARSDIDLAGQAPGPGARLLLQDVRTESLPPSQPATPGDLEALGGASVGFHLGHRGELLVVTVGSAGRSLHGWGGGRSCFLVLLLLRLVLVGLVRLVRLLLGLSRRSDRSGSRFESGVVAAGRGSRRGGLGRGLVALRP